jgi:uracil-DNA glycosylase family 4
VTVSLKLAALLEDQGALGLTGLPVRLLQKKTEKKAESPKAVETPQSTTGGSLAEIQADLGDCTRCKLCKGRKNIVFGVGNPSARLVFVGEGPGADEDVQGEPFVGKAGQLLTKMIEAMGLQRSDVYICNVVKCRPPNNRDPEPDEVAACEPFLVRQLDAIKPEIVVTLGKYAAHTLLRETTPITKMRGKWKSYHGIALMPTFHPAYLLRNPAEKRAAWADLQEVMKALGMTAPAKDRT